MKQPRLVIITLMVLLLAAAVLSAPVTAANYNTTELRIVKYASDRITVLNETTVDYHWLEANLPIQGDGVTRYYHQGPVFEGEWEKVHPDEAYDGWNPGEDVRMSILYKGDFGAVMGTDIKDICDYIGGAVDGDLINLRSSDGFSKNYPYSMIYEPDARQGPAVLCWYSGAAEGPDAQTAQGQGYLDTGYVVGMRMIFFADTSTNPWGWHVFGNTDMKECWNESYWNYGGDYPSAAGASPKWVNQVRIYSQEPPAPPVANFTANVTGGTVPFAVAFNDTSMPVATSWSWDFGDGNTSTEKNPVHTYTVAGTYNVTLTATNAAGSDTKEMIGIEATGSGGGGESPASPVVSFSANVTSGLPPLAVLFTDTSSGSPTAWSWDFGDGNTSAEQNPVHTYTAAGTYTITLTVTNAAGSNSTTEADYITLSAGMASFTANRTGGLPPLAVAFTDTSDGNPTAWSWDFGDGSTSAEQNPVHTYTAVGTYNVTLTVTGSFGSDTCVTTEPIDRIRVLTSNDIGTTTLYVSRVAADGTVLNETTVDYHWLEENLPVQGDGVTQYYHQWWVFEGDPLNPAEDNWDSIFNGKGRFGAVKGTDIKDICDLVGGASEGDSIRLESRDGYVIELNQDWVYNPLPRQGPAVLSWYNGGGGNNQGVGYPDTGYFPSMRLVFLADNSTNPWGLHIFGTYDIYVAWNITTDAATGWSVKWVDKVIIETNEPSAVPAANFTADVTSGDAPLAVAFTDASTGGPTSWSWDFGDGANATDRNTTHTYTAAGIYTVNLTVANAAGSSSATQTITVTESGGSGETDTLTLYPGWNFVSTPKRLADGANTFAIFNGVDTGGHVILLYDGTIGWTMVNSTTTFRPLDGVWIYANATYSIPLAYAADGPTLPPEKDLAKGWNAIGFSGTESRSAATTLLSLGDNWTTLIGFDAQAQEYGVSILRGTTGRHGEERPMQPTQGYWIYMTDAETLGAIGA
ncbi:MAG: PKD domain-containing protein [Acholeplasmataceae bacterium]|nr:PKD domain-containing protein [Acholeplasmataceae bacterium]